MGVEDPVDGKAAFLDEAQQAVGELGVGRPRIAVEVEHGIDEGAAPGIGVGTHIGDAVGFLVKKAGHFGLVSFGHAALLS